MTSISQARSRSNTPSADRPVAIVALAVSAVLVFAAFAVVYLLTNDVQAAGICMIATFAVLPLVVTPFLTTSDFDPFHPFFLAALSVFCGTTGRAFYLVFSSSTNVSFLLEDRPINSLLPGAIIISIGTVCMAIGFLATQSYRVPIENAKFANIHFSPARIKFTTVVVCIITAIVAIDMLRRTGFSGFHSLLDLSQKRKVVIDDVNATQGIAALGYHKLVGSLLPTVICYFVVSLAAFKQNRSLLPFAIIAALAAFVMPFLSSSRAPIVFLILTVLIIINSYQRIPFYKLAIGAACILTVLVGMKSFRQGRESAHQRSLVESTVDSLFGNRSFCGITKTTHLYEAVPEQLDMKYGKTLFLWAYAPVPRTLWPAKPEISLGYEITREVYKKDIRLGGGTPPGFMGEMIMNFGAIGVPFGCLTLGIVVSIFYNTFSPVMSTSAVLRCLYAGLLIPLGFHVITGEVSRNVINILTFLGVYFLLLFIWRKG